METRANYAAVGGFVLVLLTAILVFAVWITGASLNKGRDRYRIRFDGPVRGLQLGGKVKLFGVNVGEVEKIRLDPEQYGKIDVVITVAENTPILEGSAAELRITGLTGLSEVLITGGSPGAARIEAKQGEEFPVISAQKSQLEEIAGSVPDIVDRVNNILAKVESYLSPENAERVGSIVANVEGITGDIKVITGGISEDSENINKLIANVQSLSKKLDLLASELEGDIKEISKKLNRTLDTLDNAGLKFSKTMDSANAMIDENRAPIRRFTTVGLYEVTNLISKLQKLAEDISRIARALAREGARAFINPGGGKIKE